MREVYIIAGIVFGVGLIDHILGSPLYMKLLDILYLDGYSDLIEKYSDPARDLLRIERHWVWSNYKEYVKRCNDYILPGLSKYQLIRMFRKAKADGDYITLYNIMMDLDGEPENQISQEYRVK